MRTPVGHLDVFIKTALSCACDRRTVLLNAASAGATSQRICYAPEFRNFRRRGLGHVLGQGSMGLHTRADLYVLWRENTYRPFQRLANVPAVYTEVRGLWLRETMELKRFSPERKFEKKEFVRFERKPETSWALEIGDINDTKNPPKGVQYSRHSLVELDAEVNYGLLQAPIVARV